MIARVWMGRTKPGNTDAYENFLKGVVFPEFKKNNGYNGGYIFRKDEKEESEFIMGYVFETLAVVKVFEGTDYDIPVFEPEARRLLSKVELIARHYDVKITPM